MSGKVLVLLAEGFEECEALIVVDVLKRADITVQTASVSQDKVVASCHAIKIEADLLLGNIRPEDYDMVVLPGGIPGTPNLAACEKVREICLAFAAQGKKVAAICAAPSILGELGLLEGRSATVYPGMERTLTGATPTNVETIVDGTIITGQAMGAAIPFALELVRQLRGDAVRTQTKESICYRH